MTFELDKTVNSDIYERSDGQVSVTKDEAEAIDSILRQWFDEYDRRYDLSFVHNYERPLSPYEKRVDFEAARKVFDEDAWDADMKIREQVKKTRDNLLKTVKERAESNALTPQWVGTMTVDTPPKVVDIMADYLMDVWRKGRDLALKELPEKVSKKLADVKRFAGLEPTKAVEYLRNTRPWLIKGVIDDELKKQARFTLAEHLKGGRSLNESLGLLRDIFEPWIGDPTKITPTGMTGIGFPPGEFAPENILMAYRLENVIRTETVSAFAQGRAAVGDEADDYVIGYELSAILDTRTTELCKFADGKKFPRSHRLAEFLMPALHYQCRTIPVFVVTDDLPVEWSTEAELDRIARLKREAFA